MNKTLKRFAAVLALSFAAPLAAEPLPITLVALVPGEAAEKEAFNARLAKVPYFANAKESHSNNVVFIVSVAQVPTSGGSAAAGTTGLLAAATLGIVPIADNKDINVHYELRVNQIKVATFDYSKNFTSVQSMWGAAGKLPDDARAWLLETVDMLEKDMQANPALAALQAEYDTYFGKR